MQRSDSDVVPVDLAILASFGNQATVIVRLMMACNDISLANRFLGVSSRLSPVYVRRGAGMYFVRLQCGHLSEALKLIQEIREDRSLLQIIPHLPRFARNAFSELVNYLPSGPGHAKFYRYIESIRNKTVFHYDRSLALRGLTDRARRAESSHSKITRGTHITLWWFELADDIHDTMVCRFLWGIPREANLREEADKILDFGQTLCKAFLDFAGAYIFQYIDERAQERRPQ